MPAQQSVAHDAADQVRPGPDDARGVLLLAAIGPLVVGYVGIAALLGLITVTAPGAPLSLSGVLAAAGPVWLAGYHVPVDIAGHELGVLPLLPTAALLLLVARVAGTTARRLDLAGPGAAGRVIGPIAAAHAIFAVTLALLADGPATASPVLAFFVTGALAAGAATIGVARPCGLLSAALRRADDATVAGLRAGIRAVLGLAAVGAVVFAIGLVASWSTSAQLFRASAPGFGSGLGMFLLSVAYLPNALIATLSFAAGPGFGIGVVSVAQWHFHGGPLPAVPLLAPLPAVEGHWWVFLMLLPAAVGVLTGLVCRRDPAGRFRVVLVAALVTGISWLILAAMAGGALAGGPFDPVAVPAGSLAVSAFLAIAIPGTLTVWLAGRTPALLGMADDHDEYEEYDDTTEIEPGEPADPE